MLLFLPCDFSIKSLLMELPYSLGLDHDDPKFIRVIPDRSNYLSSQLTPPEFPALDWVYVSEIGTHGIHYECWTS